MTKSDRRFSTPNAQRLANAPSPPLPSGLTLRDAVGEYINERCRSVFGVLHCLSSDLRSAISSAHAEMNSCSIATCSASS